MVIRGATRGNGQQLAGYLLSKKENEAVSIIEVTGKRSANDNELSYALKGMALTSELTKSEKGLYHAVINPAPGDDRKMDAEDWVQAADILAKHIRLDGQRRVIVLHEKKGRTHAHVVFERYDHEKGKMKSDSWNYRGQDKARFEMEKVFAQQKTPHKNVKRPEARKDLTELWNGTTSAKEFIAAAKARGYAVARGEARRPFMVVDETGRSFDLVRELQGVKTKDVRARFQREPLKTEKEEIAAIRAKQPAKDQPDAAQDAPKRTRAELAYQFTESRSDVADAKKARQEDTDPKSKTVRQDEAAGDGHQQRPADADQERFKKTAKLFAENRDEQLAPETEQQRFERQLHETLERMRQQQKDKEKGKDFGLDFGPG